MKSWIWSGVMVVTGLAIMVACGTSDTPVTHPYPTPSPSTSPASPQQIVCEDGYAWPGTVRKGACHGHGGVI